MRRWARAALAEEWTSSRALARLGRRRPAATDRDARSLSAGDAGGLAGRRQDEAIAHEAMVRGLVRRFDPASGNPGVDRAGDRPRRLVTTSEGVLEVREPRSPSSNQARHAGSRTRAAVCSYSSRSSSVRTSRQRPLRPRCRKKPLANTSLPCAMRSRMASTLTAARMAGIAASGTSTPTNAPMRRISDHAAACGTELELHVQRTRDVCLLLPAARVHDRLGGGGVGVRPKPACITDAFGPPSYGKDLSHRG